MTLNLDDNFLDKLQQRFLDIPYALDEDGWKKWHIETKKNKPYSYLLFYIIPNKIDDWIIQPYSDIKYWFKYRIFPSYRRYWNVRPKKLKVGYNDARELLLHSSFQILCDFYEFQICPNSNVDWEANEVQQHIMKEMTELYEYWNKHEELWKKHEELYDVYSCKQTDKERHEFSSFIQKHENDLVAQEDLMLKRLIDIRVYLWD